MLLVIGQLLLVGLTLASPLNVNTYNQKIIIEKINRMNAGFTARHYPEFDLPLNELRAMFGNKDGKMKPLKSTPPNYRDLTTNGIDRFDARDAWSSCKDVIGNIPAKGNCDASWALSIAGAISDRRCISGVSSAIISGYDLLSCCDDCQLEPNNGCAGGDISTAAHYFKTIGITTGSNYHSFEGCKPYPYPANGTKITSTKCAQKCSSDYKKNYSDDLVIGVGQQSYLLSNSKVMEEVQKYGSVVTEFDVYEDFLQYRGGIYRHTTGNHIGKTQAKIIGWGADEKDSYWLAVYSQAANWGESGLFRILRGTNECNFESEVIASYVNTTK